MKQIAALILFLCTAPAFAADWSRFENSRFGYSVEVPPGFRPSGAAPENADGAAFASEDGTQSLTVWGGNVIEEGFESSVQAAIGFARDERWTISYGRVTPSWASYSGWRNGIVLYARTIALCGGTQYASFHYEYPERDIATLETVVDRLVRSLKATGEGEGC
jgi:hypothetical protein